MVDALRQTLGAGRDAGAGATVAPEPTPGRCSPRSRSNWDSAAGLSILASEPGLRASETKTSDNGSSRRDTAAGSTPPSGERR
jgi:hypothetical protein